MCSVIDDGPAAAPWRLILAHGAGAPMTSPFMDGFAALLAGRDVAVARFEFAYMAARRESGKRKPPPRADTLLPEYRKVIASVCARLAPGQRLLIGGKSMGGRVASMIADELFRDGRIAGLVCLGYPFHPPAAPDKLRIAHLGHDFSCPTLIVQGERDPFGTKAEIEGYDLAPAIRFHWAVDGDHDLGPRGSAGVTRKGNLAAAADAVAAFALGLDSAAAFKPSDGGRGPHAQAPRK